MSKFMIECPKCHRYNEASNGLLARRNIPCSCGNIINVKNDKITTRVCPGCGNTVIYDQSEGAKAKCPVCHQQLVADSDHSKMIHFPCETCGCLLQVSKTALNIRCPLCGADNDVQEAVKKAQIRDKGEPVMIEYRGQPNTLVWRHPMTEFSLGSRLIVREGQEAIFLLNGEAMDSFGPGKHVLETPILPKMQEKLGSLSQDVPFRAEVYFINMTTQFNQKWGTPSKVSLRDPETRISFDIGASGGFSIRIVNARKILSRVVGTQEQMSSEQLFDMSAGFFRQTVLGRIRARLAQCIMSQNIPILELDAHLDEITEAIQKAVNGDLEEYGIELPNFSVVNIVYPDDDPHFKKLKEYYARKVLDLNNAKLEAEIKRAEIESAAAEAEAEAARKRILGQADADVYRAKANAEAEEMRNKGYTYRDQTERDVATAAMSHPSPAGDVGGMSSDLVKLGVQMGMARQVADIVSNAAGGFSPDAGRTPPPAQAAQSGDSFETRVKKLQFMLESHAITKEMYDQKIAQILAEI